LPLPVPIRHMLIKQSTNDIFILFLSSLRYLLPLEKFIRIRKTLLTLRLTSPNLHVRIPYNHLINYHVFILTRLTSFLLYRYQFHLQIPYTLLIRILLRHQLGDDFEGGLAIFDSGVDVVHIRIGIYEFRGLIVVIRKGA